MLKKIFTENTKYSRKVTIGVWRSFRSSLLSLFFVSKPGVSSVGTSTSPQQQNPQTGADKDPCEVHFALKTRLFINKNCGFLMFTSRIFQLRHISAKLNAIKRQNWHQIRIFCTFVFNAFKCWKMNEKTRKDLLLDVSGSS